MPNTNADGSPASSTPGWFDNIFSSVKQLGSLAGTAAAWKELVDPVKAVQQPTLGTGSAGPVPIITPPPAKSGGPAVPGQIPNPIIWYIVGGLAFLLFAVMLSRRS